MNYDTLMNTLFWRRDRAGGAVVTRIRNDYLTGDGAPSMLTTVRVKRTSKTGRTYYDQMPLGRLLDERIYPMRSPRYL